MNLFLDQKRRRLTFSGVVALVFGVIVGLLGCYSIAEIITNLLNIRGMEEAISGTLSTLFLIMIWHITHEDEKDQLWISLMWYGGWFTLVIFILISVVSNLF